MIAEWMITIQKPLTFLYTNNKQLETEITKKEKKFPWLDSWPQLLVLVFALKDTFLKTSGRRGIRSVDYIIILILILIIGL